MQTELSAKSLFPVKSVKKLNLKQGISWIFRKETRVIKLVSVVVTAKQQMDRLPVIVAETRADY